MKSDILGYTKILLIVLIVLCIIFTSGCGGNKNDAKAPRDNSESGGSWESFRGDRNLSGLSESRIPDRPELLWSFKTGDEVRGGAVSDGESVYIGSMDGFAYSLALSDGSLVWSFDTKNSIEASCLLLGGSVYVGNYEGELFSLDAKSGRVSWHIKTGAEITGSANWFMKEENNYIVFGSHDNSLYCVNANDGGIVWTYDTKNFINGSCSVYENTIAFGGCDALIHIIGTDGKQIREIDSGSYIASSVFMDGTSIVAGNYSGKLLHIDSKNGQLLWDYENEGTPFFSSPAVTDHMIFVGSRDGFLNCFDRNNGTVIWKLLTGKDVDSSPVVAGDKVVFGSGDGRLYITDVATGKKAWSYDTGSPIVAPPAIVDEKIIIGCEEGTVFAFGRNTDA